MFKELAPYQIAALIGSVTIVLVVFYLQSIGTGRFLNYGSLLGFSIVVYLLCLLEIGMKVRDHRRGHFYPMRNATTIVGSCTILAFPILTLQGMTAGVAWISPPTLCLLPVFLYMCLRALFWVRLDEVQLAAKIGLRAPRRVPRFRIQSVVEDERGLVVRGDAGEEFHLFRVFFFAGDWERLRKDLLGQVG